MTASLGCQAALVLGLAPRRYCGGPWQYGPCANAVSARSIDDGGCCEVWTGVRRGRRQTRLWVLRLGS